MLAFSKTRRTPGALLFPLIVLFFPFFIVCVFARVFIVIVIADDVRNLVKAGLQVFVFRFQFVDSVQQFASGLHSHFPCSFWIVQLDMTILGAVFEASSSISAARSSSPRTSRVKRTACAFRRSSCWRGSD